MSRESGSETFPRGYASLLRLGDGEAGRTGIPRATAGGAPRGGTGETCAGTGGPPTWPAGRAAAPGRDLA